MSNFDFYNIETGEGYSDSELENLYEENLNEVYGTVEVCGFPQESGTALRRLDYIAFREGFNNWIDGAYTEDEPEDEDTDED